MECQCYLLTALLTVSVGCLIAAVVFYGRGRSKISKVAIGLGFLIAALLTVMVLEG